MSPLIELTFDRDMDPQATSAAWSFYDPDGDQLSGEIDWPDARTLRFSPDSRLEPDSRYLGILSVSAVSVVGEPLEDDLRLDFHTGSAFMVGQVLPADGTKDVDVGTSITVVFNRPVVPLTIFEEQSGLPQPLQMDPPVTGEGEWVNSSMYIFTPGEALDSGVNYQLRVDASLSDTGGESLESEFVWSFSTQEVSGYMSDEDYDRLLLDAAIRVEFVQPMDTASVAAALSVIDRETGAAIPVQLEWFGDDSSLVVKPVGMYRIASF